MGRQGDVLELRADCVCGSGVHDDEVIWIAAELGFSRFIYKTQPIIDMSMSAK